MRPFLHFSERGFSLVELMVAMLIGLIGMIIIFQVFQVSEGIKRTTTGGGDSQQNGVIALYTIERDLRNAGMGFNDSPNPPAVPTVAGCNIVGYDSLRTPKDFPPVGVTIKLSPVFITSGAASTAPDQVSVFYGSQGQAVASVPLGANMDPTKNGTDPLNVKNPFGYSAGDVLLLVEPGTAKNCSLMEATFVDSTVVRHEVAPYLAGTTTRTPRFNKPGGLGVVYQGQDTLNVSRVLNLGNLYYAPAGGSGSPVNMPVYNTYKVENGSLTVTWEFPPDIKKGVPLVVPAADNIVHMRALYGLDDGVDDMLTVTYNTTPKTAGDFIVDRYVDAATFNAILPAPPWQSLIAIRVAVVARSTQPEKASSGKAGDPCDTTTAEPQWTGTPWAASLNYRTRLDVTATVAAPDDWKCYRYRVFETTVPLRNWIWKPSTS